VTLICETDEGNPTPLIQWYKGTQPISANLRDVYNTLGAYAAQKAKSEIKIDMDISYNNSIFTCSVQGNNQTIKQDYTFSVASEYIVVLIYFVKSEYNAVFI
jgi:hypothetical protein